MRASKSSFHQILAGSLLIALCYSLMFLQASVRQARGVGFDLDYYAGSNLESVNVYKGVLNALMSNFDLGWAFIGLVPLLISLLLLRLFVFPLINAKRRATFLLTLIAFPPFMYLASSGYRDLILSVSLAVCFISILERKFLSAILSLLLILLLRNFSILVLFTSLIIFYSRPRALIVFILPLACFFGSAVGVLVSDEIAFLLRETREAYAPAILASNSNILREEFFDYTSAFDIIASGLVYYCVMIASLPFLSSLNLMVLFGSLIVMYFLRPVTGIDWRVYASFFGGYL